MVSYWRQDNTFCMFKSTNSTISRNLLLGVGAPSPRRRCPMHGWLCCACHQTSYCMCPPAYFAPSVPSSSLFVCTTAELDYGCRRVRPSLDTVAACSSTFCTCCPLLIASKAIFVEPHRRRSSAPCTHHHHSSLSARTKGSIPPPTLPTSSRPTHYPKVSWSSKEEAVHEPRCCFEPLRPPRLLLRRE